MKLRIVIADDHAVLRAGLRALLNTQTDMEVVGEAGDGAEALTKSRELQPDMVLLDLAMPAHGGLAAIAKITAACPSARVLVLTMYDDPAYIRSVMDAGGAGYVVKTAADTELLTAIRAVAEGHMFMNLQVAAQAFQTSLRGQEECQTGPAKSINLLSEREREVLNFVAHGQTNKEIADRLNLSVKSVETYRARLMDKLGLRSRADLVRYAMDGGLLLPRKPLDFLP